MGEIELPLDKILTDKAKLAIKDHKIRLIEEELKKYQQCLDEIFENIEYVEATAERIDDDNYIALAYRIAETSRNILRLIKQAKESR